MLESLATIHIKNLRLRTLIGINPEELEKKQDITLNIHIGYDAKKATSCDTIDHAVNYRSITKKVITFVENNQFSLLEKLTQDVLNLVCDNPHICGASVEIDKPHALRFADSVSLKLTYGDPIR